MNYRRFFLIFFLILSMNANAKLLGSASDIYKPIVEYNKVHRSFFKNVCAGSDVKYYSLLKDYRGQGYYLPEVNKDIDRDAIQNNIHHFKKKILHIKKILDKLKLRKKMPKFKLVAEATLESVKKLLKHKKEFHTSVLPKVKLEARRKSMLELRVFQNTFKVLMDQLFFLQSYNFPNDHLGNRQKYDSLKDKKGTRNKKGANRTFFYRRLVEDGANDKNRSRADIYLRSTLDTLYLNIMKPQIFLDENIRYDLMWVFRYVERLMNRGLKVQISRIHEWHKRTEKAYEFYKDIIRSENKAKARQIVEKKNKASNALKKFVVQKQKDTYLYWTKQSELDRALYVMSTILYNEVGTVDGNDALERTDVAQIVMNRHETTLYRRLSRKQPLTSALELSHREMSRYPWLNVLFREGEFSFTYFYISSVSKIFCPDMSRRGRGIRSRNLQISMLALKHERNHFNAIRYFSRISMLGKVDMGQVWTEYTKYPERAGKEIERQKEFLKKYNTNDYDYLYSFKDPSGETFKVVMIDGKHYCLTWRKGKPVFYSYRDPNLFTYFTKI